MSEKVVLPKFDIPSEEMHPATKAVLAVGMLLAVSFGVLGLAVWRRHAAQTAAESRAEAIIAARTAEANAAAEAAKARVAEAEAKAAAVKAEAQAKLALASAHDGGVAAKAGSPAGAHHRDHGHHHGRAAAGKGTVASKGDDKKASSKSTRDNGAIDKLLASFK